MTDRTINKIISKSPNLQESLLDLTSDSVSPENLLLNETAHNNEGEGIVGMMPEGGASDYDALNNRPQINSNLLTGNKTGGQLGLQNKNLDSPITIGEQTVNTVEGALSALNGKKADIVGGKVPVNELPVYTPVIGSIQSIGGIVPPSSSGDEDKYLRSDGTWAKPSGGGGGVSDYDDLTNRPKVNGTTLSEDKTGTQLGLQNIILSSTLSIGGQTVTEVEEALGSLAGISKPMTGATSSSAGKGGFVPSPSAGDENKALFGDGTWKPVSGGGGGHTILDEDGITYPQRSKLQFEGCEVTDDAVNDTTIVTCVGGGSIYAKPVMASSSFTYNGSAQSPTLTGFDSEAMTITGDYEATNVGNYSFTVALKDKTKSKWIDNTTTDLVFNWSISKANSNTTASASSVSLNTSNTSRTVTLSNVTGTVTVSSSDTSVATASVSNNTVTIAGVNHKDGSATITISVAASTNYKAKTLTVSVSASYKSTITVTLYSAASDTVSFTDDAGSKTAVTDTSGKKTSVSIVIPYNGKTITFTSSVAKKPSNLSNAYSKSIALTRSTTTVYVMPNGALYWWGYGSENLKQASSSWCPWYPSYTAKSVTYNTQNIQLGPCPDEYYIGVTSKDKVACSTINVINSRSGIGGDGWCVALCTNTSSAMGSQTYRQYINTATSAMELTTYSAVQGNYYPTFETGNGNRTGVCYALWYE